MRFRNRKTSVLLVFAFLLMVQIVFSGKNSDGQDLDKPVLVDSHQENIEATVNQVQVAENSDSGLYTEEEVVTAGLNVVYRSNVTSTESVDEVEDSIDSGDFDNKVISYICERLNVYEEPNLNSKVVGVMYSESVADVVTKGKNWSKISSGNVTGYIRNVDVLFGNEAQAMAEYVGQKKATVLVDNLTVLSDADAASEKISSLAKGAVIDAYDEYGNFLLVICDKGYGYIDKKCVSIEYGFDKAVTIEEEEQFLAAQKAEEAKAAAEAEAKRRAEEAAKRAEEAKKAEKENYRDVGTTTRNPYNASAEEVHLLAAIIYWESGWEPRDGQIAVANVVLNRVLSSRFSQNSIASVIYAPGQFYGVAENGGPSARFQSVLNMSDAQLNQRGCYDAAVSALAGNNNIGDMLFFINVKKATFAKYSGYTIINNHCFYIY